MKIETPMLRRLGPVPFWRGETKCLDELERIYRRARAAAAERIGCSSDTGHKTSRQRIAGDGKIW